MTDWSDIEDALHAWVNAASATLDIPAGNILWSDQDAPEAEDHPTVIVRRGDLDPVGAPYLQENFDEDAEAGKEFELKVTASKILSLRLQAFDSRKVGDVTGSTILSVIQNALELPSVRDALLAAGLCPYGDNETIRNVTALEGADFESRAVLDVQFLLTDTLSEFTGYIQTIEFTPTVDTVALPKITLTLPEE